MDDVVGNLLETMYDAMLIRGDDYPSLPKYLEASAHRNDVLEEAGFGVANPKFRDAFMRELMDRRQGTSKLYLALKGWKEATPEVKLEKEVQAKK